VVRRSLRGKEVLYSNIFSCVSQFAPIRGRVKAHSGQSQLLCAKRGGQADRIVANIAKLPGLLQKIEVATPFATFGRGRLSAKENTS
jgi:hypothetical protein